MDSYASSPKQSRRRLDFVHISGQVTSEVIVHVPGHDHNRPTLSYVTHSGRSTITGGARSFDETVFHLETQIENA
jgi:hypothetical protein